VGFAAKKTVFKTLKMTKKPYLPQRKILILEEDPSLRNALLTLLAGIGCEADVVYSGNQAIEIIRNEKFDAVLLDLRCAHSQAEEVVPSIHSLRPSLVSNVLVITGDVVDAKTLDLIERYFLLHVSGHRPVQDMVATLRVLLHLPPALNYA
jgi:DNA-binding response OmpR family regulator